VPAAELKPAMSDSAPKTTPTHHGAFGSDRFGVLAERFARFFGTPRFIIGQTVVVLTWIVFNGFQLLVHFDKYPFILLNLAFSTQAAYAAPLILLAQTRQADRDKARAETFEQHRAELERRQQAYDARQAHVLEQDRQLAEEHSRMLAQNTELTQRVVELTERLHATVCDQPPRRGGS
jgi:uncharacterized membrane protein